MLPIPILIRKFLFQRMCKMDRSTLLEIGARTRSGKWMAHTYLPIYDELFAPFRDEPITIVEFGVCVGNSMRMWLEYFSKARIIGVDNLIENVTAANEIHPRITAHHHEQQDPEVARIVATFRPHIIIDDAGHNDEHQRICFGYCWPYVQSGGLYIVEDIQSPNYLSYWKDRGAVVHENYTSSELGDYRYDDILVVLHKP